MKTEFVERKASVVSLKDVETGDVVCTIPTKEICANKYAIVIDRHTPRGRRGNTVMVFSIRDNAVENWANRTQVRITETKLVIEKE